MAAVCLCAGLSDAPPAAAQQHTHDEGIVELAVERLPPLTLLVLVDSAGGILLPVAAVAAHLGYTPDRTHGVLSLPRPGGGDARVDALTRTLILGGDTLRLAPAELVVRDGVTYLHIDRLAAVLDAELRLEPATLTVVISRASAFPAQQRVIAEQRRTVLLARQRHLSQRAQLEAVPYPALSGAGVLDWQLSTAGLDPLRLTALRTQAGVALLGGDFGAGATFELGRAAQDHVRDVVARYHRVFPTQRALTQFSAGDVITSGLFARFVQGVEVSNRPFHRAGDIGDVLVSPDLPPGWEYEVFQGSQLLGYSEPGSRAPVSVPLRAGTTPVQVRMYGPAGEEVVTTLLYQTPVSALSAGSFEYAAAAGTCRGDVCDRFGHLDLRYGVSTRLTLGGGFEYIADSTQVTLRPYSVASFASGLRWTGDLQFMPGALYSGAAAVFPRDGSTTLLRGTIARPGFGPISLLPDAASRWDVELGWDERLPATDANRHALLRPLANLRVGVAAGGTTSAGDDGTSLERWRVSAAGGLRSGYIEARHDFHRTAPRPHLFTGRAALITPVVAGGRTHRPLLSGALGLGRVGLRLLEAGASLQPTGNAVLHAGVQWHRGADRPALTVGWSARTGAVQSTLRGVAGSGGGSSAAIISGSTAIAHDGRVSHRATARAGYAGLRGVVFVDHDGDGRFSPGDETVPGATLVAGGVPVTADDHGRYVIWGLLPYAPTTIAIDSTRIPDPSWATAAPEVVVRPVPNTARRVDLALVRTRELLGSLTADPDVATVAGVSVLITDRDSGATLTAITFSDGQFYVSRLRPGRYRITVAEASLRALAAVAAPAHVDFTITATGDDVFVELPPLHLSRDTASASPALPALPASSALRGM
jgi:hypothetical protein